MAELLGARLKRLREREKLSQVELAQRLHISNTTLSQYENNHRIPSDEIKAKIADCFSVSVDYLIGRTPYKAEEKQAVDIELQQLEDKYLMLPKDMRTDAIRYIDYLISRDDRKDR